MKEQMRAEFEAWADKELYALDKREGSDRYRNVITRNAWLGWQAALSAVPAQEPVKQESKPALKVLNGEICYQSTDDDQSYGMWCPIAYDTVHGFVEGTKFIAMPPVKEVTE